MLAGLLLALQDADDRPGVLTATLPFGGLTLVEFQARLLIAAGASQIVVIAARFSPELLGALSRIGRRGVAVDTVRSAAEAAEKLHPLAKVVMLADGLTASAATVAAMAADDMRDTLLVVPDDHDTAAFERVGGGMLWAGIAQLAPQRLDELAEMPRDYDIQSTLLRLASQAGAQHVVLPHQMIRQGHGIEHRAALMETRSRTVLSALVSARRGWFDRFVVNPLARPAMAPLVQRAIPAAAVIAVTTLLAIGSMAALWFDRPVIGLIGTIATGVGLSIAGLLADLRDEPASLRTAWWGARVVPALAVLLVGYRETVATADHGAIAVALAALVAAGLVERARPQTTPAWWATPPAYPFVLLAGVLPGMATAGLVVAGVYAAATLASAIERLVRQP